MVESFRSSSRVLCVALCLAVCPPAARAARDEQTDPTASVANSPRALGGHLFQPSVYVPGPFTYTSFGSRTNFGYGFSRGPILGATGQITGSKDYDMIAAGLGFDASFIVFRDLSVRASFAGNIFSGFSGGGALVIGTTALVDGNLGIVWGKTFGNARLGLVLDVGERPNGTLLIANAIIAAIQTGQIPSGDTLLDKTSRFYVTPGISGAWAPHKAFGLVGEVRYLWSEKSSGETESGTRQGFVLSGAADVDFDQLWGFPINLAGIYRSENPAGGGGIVRVKNYGGAIFYSRRVRLQLGLELTRQEQVLNSNTFISSDARSTIGVIRLRYYW